MRAKPWSSERESLPAKPAARRDQVLRVAEVVLAAKDMALVRLEAADGAHLPGY
jgi:hypothetical protein